MGLYLKIYKYSVSVDQEFVIVKIRISYIILLFPLSERVCKHDFRRMGRKMNTRWHKTQQVTPSFLLEDCIKAERDLMLIQSCLLFIVMK